MVGKEGGDQYRIRSGRLVVTVTRSERKVTSGRS